MLINLELRLQTYTDGGDDWGFQYPVVVLFVCIPASEIKVFTRYLFVFKHRKIMSVHVICLYSNT